MQVHLTRHLYGNRLHKPPVQWRFSLHLALYLHRGDPAFRRRSRPTTHSWANCNNDLFPSWPRGPGINTHAHTARTRRGPASQPTAGARVAVSLLPSQEMRVWPVFILQILSPHVLQL